MVCLLHIFLHFLWGEVELVPAVPDNQCFGSGSGIRISLSDPIGSYENFFNKTWRILGNYLKVYNFVFLQIWVIVGPIFFRNIKIMQADQSSFITARFAKQCVQLIKTIFFLFQKFKQNILYVYLGKYNKRSMVIILC